MRHLKFNGLLNGSGNFRCYIGKFLLCELYAGCLEIQITDTVDRHKVDVVMGYVDADNRHANALTRQHLLHRFRNFLGEDHHIAQHLVVQIENVVVLELCDDERVALCERGNVEKSEETVVLRNLIARDVTLDNLRENGLFHSDCF